MSGDEQANVRPPPRFPTTPHGFRVTKFAQQCTCQNNSMHKHGTRQQRSSPILIVLMFRACWRGDNVKTNSEWLGRDNTPWPLSFIRVYEWMGLGPTSFPVRSSPNTATQSRLYSPITSKIAHSRHFFTTWVHIGRVPEVEMSLNHGKDSQAVIWIVHSSMFERQNSFTFLSFQTELAEPTAPVTERFEVYLLIGRMICHLLRIFVK